MLGLCLTPVVLAAGQAHAQGTPAAPAPTMVTSPSSEERTEPPAAVIAPAPASSTEAMRHAPMPALTSAPPVGPTREQTQSASPAAPAQTFADDEELPRKDSPAKAESSAPTKVQKNQLPHNLSPWGMFLAADAVVKAVMTSLAVASVLVWTAWIAKLAQVGTARRRTRASTDRLEELPSIAAAAAELSDGRDPVSAMVRATMREIELSGRGAMPAEGIKERVVSRLSRIEATAGRSMNSGTGLLATVGGTAPFVGLFGTVWGIMNSFIGISKAQTTNLAVVAPGIAEALLATAIGLVAAIPAVIFYNQLARAISAYKGALADTSAVLERHVSRDLDRMRGAHAHHLEAAE